MPFDPTLPVNNSPISSAELRSQFIALNDLICDFAAQASENPNNTANGISAQKPRLRVCEISATFPT